MKQILQVLFLFLGIFETQNVYSQEKTAGDSIMPKYPTGEQGCFNYLSHKIRYPKKEQSKGITGTVFISYVINKKGKIKQVKVAKGVIGGKGLDKEAKKLIKSMPDWIPGKINGIPADFKLTLPIKFTLK